MFVKWVNGWSFKVTVGAFCCDADTMQSDAKQRCPRPDMIHRQYANSHPAALPRPSHPTIPHATPADQLVWPLLFYFQRHCSSAFYTTVLLSVGILGLIAQLTAHSLIGWALYSRVGGLDGVGTCCHRRKPARRFFYIFIFTGYHASHT